MVFGLFKNKGRLLEIAVEGEDVVVYELKEVGKGVMDRVEIKRGKLPKDSDP